MKSADRILIAIATYNEIENIPKLYEAVRSGVPDADVLVIDDGSPDGTGAWCDSRAENDPQLKCIHREGKLGLGSATMVAFRHALTHDYNLILTMDADFSHQPQYLPDLIAPLTQGPDTQEVDVVIGSRYVEGGGVTGWPLFRRIMSRGVNSYARLLLGLKVRDCSGAFRCYRTDALRKMDLDQMRSTGYSYLEEILWHLKRTGTRFVEVPIIFIDREFGSTKINAKEAMAALWIIFKLGIRNWTGR